MKSPDTVRSSSDWPVKSAHVPRATQAAIRTSAMVRLIVEVVPDSTLRSMTTHLNADLLSDLHADFVYSGSDVAQLRDGVQTHGFACLPDAFAPPLLEALQQEAQERLGLALPAEQTTGLQYRANIISLGPVASRVLGGRDARELLRAVFAEELTLSEGVSCLTLYGEGDHLGAHLDQPASECAVTILVYLAATGGTSPPSPVTGLVLRVYGEQEPHGEAPRLTIPTRAGAIVVGWGSRVWHERPRLLAGEQVIALTGCFKRIL